MKCLDQLKGLDSRYVYSPTLVSKLLKKSLKNELRGKDGREGERSWILVNSVTESLF
jgi:hypothetical protein